MQSFTFITLMAVFAVSAVFLSYGFFEAHWMKISYFTFSHRDIPENFSQKRIVFVSDFHCGFGFGADRVSQIVKKINELNPDIVVLGGDYVDSSKNYIDICFGELKNLRSKYGVYGVLGNHDYLVGDGAIKEAMVKASIIVLDNDSRWLEISGQKIKIGGVGDFLKGTAILQPTIRDVEKKDFVVLVVHNPSFFDKISEKIDLVLSGHTHGGQITFFGFWRPFFELKYGSKYISGVYRSKNSTLLVSNGVGTTILPIRFFARPEINVITLERSDR